MTSSAISIKNLKKTYESGVEALKGIDLEVKEGDFFALLGPNGAGKSTAIGIITSLINKTDGNVEVFGTDLDKDRNKVKSYIGLVPQEFNFNFFEKVIDIIVQQAGYYGIPRVKAKENAKKYLKELHLWDKRNVIGHDLSGGLKRRLMIARALVHEPKLLILDEPTAGVDIEIRRSMWKFIKKLNKSGTTIILTTHYLEEAEQLCKNVAIINKGEIIINTSIKSLLSTLYKETFIFDIDKSINTLPKIKDVSLILIDSHTIEATVPKSQNLNKIFEVFKKNNIIVSSMRNKANRLEELFLDLIEK